MASKPWASRQEMLVDIALESAVSDPETIRQIRPVVPQQLMPERHGFAKRESGIMDVLSLERHNPTYRSWVSGAPVISLTCFTLSLLKRALNESCENKVSRLL